MWPDRLRRASHRTVDVVFRGVSLVEQWVQKHFGLTLAIAAGLIAVNEVSIFGTDIAHWDWLFVTGWMTFVIGWRVALGLSAIADQAIDRLADRRVLRGNVAELHAQLAHSAEQLSRVIGLVTAAVVLTGFIAAFSAGVVNRAWFTSLAVVAGVFVGRVFGRGIAVARLGRHIERGRWEIKAQPGHVDGAAGLKPVGDLYFRQAMVLAIPALFLAVWWFLMPIVGRYEHWRDAYLGQLSFAIGIEMAAFVAPILAFHRIMVKQKRKLLSDTDPLSEELQGLEQELPTITDDAKRQSVGERVELLRARYLQVESMPTWPVDGSLRRRFRLNNALLLLPLAVKAIGLTLPGGELLTKIGEILGEQ